MKLLMEGVKHEVAAWDTVTSQMNRDHLARDFDTFYHGIEDLDCP
jgi:hypothetical protein